MRAPLCASLAWAVLLACSGSDPAPRTGAVTITVTDVAPVAGAYVVFHHPDGTVQELAATDTSGKATAVITEGALATVGRFLWGTTDRWDLTTVAGLEPGDDLLVDPWGAGGFLTGFGTVTFSGPVEGGSSYRVDASCTAAAADSGYVDSLSLPLISPDCGTSLDALALARAPGGPLLAYATALDVPIAGAAPSQTASVALGAWRTDFGTMALEATNAPAGSTTIRANLTPRRSGRSYAYSDSWYWGALAPGGSASVALTYPQAFATSGQLRIVVYYGVPGGPDAGWIFDADAALAPRSIDLSTSLPPRLSGAALADTGGTLEASWQQAGADPALDGVTLVTTWTAGGAEHVWRVAAPPGTTSFAFPPLPPEMAGFEPAAGAAPGLIVSAYDIAETNGYGAFKATRLGLLGGVEGTGFSVLRGTSTASGPP